MLTVMVTKVLMRLQLWQNNEKVFLKTNLRRNETFILISSSWGLPGRHEGRIKRLRGPLDPAGPGLHATPLSDDCVRRHSHSCPRSLDCLLLRLGPCTQTWPRAGGGRGGRLRLAAEGPTQISSPVVSLSLAQVVSEEGLPAQLL